MTQVNAVKPLNLRDSVLQFLGGHILGLTEFMPKAIHQITAGYANGDAISNEACVLREVIRGWGFESQIYCERNRTLPELRKDIGDLADLPGHIAPDDVVMLHLSIGCDANLRFSELNCRKVIRYHNVTPSVYFRALNENIANQLAKGRDHVEMLAGVADINTAVSGYDAGELEAAGYSDVQVIPLVLDLDRLTARLNQHLVQDMLRTALLNLEVIDRAAHAPALGGHFLSGHAVQIG